MMNIHSRADLKSSFSRKFIRLCILSLIVVSALLKVNKARADIAPPEPPSGTNPLPGNESTNVRMMAETVLVDIDGTSPLDEGLAKVTATFTMRNLGDVDESMDVRFPLDQTTTWGNLCKATAPQFPTIADLKVKVNGQSSATQKTYETITLPTLEEPYPTITIPCWEHFPVSFPVGKDIIIEVIYTTEPYHDWDASYVYSYILETGVGWRGTIGSADIIFRLPYDLSDSNFYSCHPSDCTINEKKIYWHYEDFEPTSNIGISMLPPPLWQRITLETKNTTQNPNDGEAWGRLGKAYKEAVMELKGFRSDRLGQERYQLSKQAYERAVTLLPNDADWHYGFAELLCWNAGWNNAFGNANEKEWQECVEQIKETLDINPAHEKTKELIQPFFRAYSND